MEGAGGRFVEIAVEPLADEPEVEALARGELEERIEGAGVGEEEIEVARRRLQRDDAAGGMARRRQLRRWVAGIGLVLTVLLLVPAGMRKMGGLVALRSTGAMLGSSFGGVPSGADQLALDRWVGRGLSEDERSFLLGKFSSSEERMRRLWESRPDGAAVFADYLAHRRLGGLLPEGVLETAQGLDPDNAHFLLLVAGERADGAVEGKRRAAAGSGTRRNALQDWEILDEGAVQETLELMDRAAGMARCESYEGEMMAARLRMLPEQVDLSSGLLRMSFAAAQPSSRYGVVKVSRVLAAESQRLAEAGDREGLKRLLASWETVAGMLVEDCNSLIDVLIARAFVGQVAKHAAESCTELGLEEEAKRLTELTGKLDALHQRGRSGSGPSTEDEQRIERHGSALAALALPMLGRLSRDVGAPSLAELKPGRMAEYALADQLFALVMTLLCLLGALAIWLSLVLRSRGLRRLGDRMEGLLDGWDWCWIGMLGLLLPLAGYLLLTRWGPTGGREFGPRLTMFLVPVTQAACLPPLMGLALVQAVEWRLRRRGRVLGFGPRRQWIGWMATGICLAAVAMPGLTLRWPGSGAWLLRVPAAVAALAFLGLLVQIGLVLFGRRRRALERQVAGLVLLPVLVVAAVLFASAVPLLEREEKSWVARDGLMRIDPDRPAMSGYEWEVTQAVKAELQEMMK